MGKGDPKSKKGKIAKGSYGVSRPKPSKRVPALSDDKVKVEKGRKVVIDDK